MKSTEGKYFLKPYVHLNGYNYSEYQYTKRVKPHGHMMYIKSESVHSYNNLTTQEISFSNSCLFEWRDLINSIVRDESKWFILCGDFFEALEWHAKLLFFSS